MIVKRVLVSDDNVNRVAYYQVLMVLGAVVVWAPTALETARVLQEGEPFDLVALDHDFRAADCIADPEESTGRGTAKVIAALPPEKRPPIVLLHSANAAGREAMAAILRSAGIEPVVAPLPNLFPP